MSALVLTVALAVLLCALTFALGRSLGNATVHRRTLADSWEAGRAEQYAADLLGRDTRPNPWRRRG